MKQTSEIGRIGEEQVRKMLSGIPNTRLIANLIIPYPGGTVEIDAALVTAKGIYVLEVKNFSASSSLKGSLIRYEWTQTIKRPGKKPFKRKIYSPIKQADAHLSVLVRFLRQQGVRISKTQCRSVIVFALNCELNVPQTKDHTLLHGRMLHGYIARQLKMRKDALTVDERKAVAKALEKVAGASEKERDAHVKHVKRTERKRLVERDRKRRNRKSSR